MPSKITTTHDLFFEKLNSLYAGLQKISNEIDKIAPAASSLELNQAIQMIKQQLQQQLPQLEQTAAAIGYSFEAGSTDTIDAIIREVQTLISKRDGQADIDLGLILALQTAISYELYSYSFVSNIASALGINPVMVQMTRTAFIQLETSNQQLTSLFQDQLNQLRVTAKPSSTTIATQPHIEQLKTKIDQQKQQLEQISKQPPELQGQQLEQLKQQVEQQQQQVNQIKQSPQSPQKLEQNQKNVQDKLKQQEQELSKSTPGQGIKAKAQELLSKIGG